MGLFCFKSSQMRTLVWGCKDTMCGTVSAPRFKGRSKCDVDDFKQMQEDASHLYVHFQSILLGFLKHWSSCRFCCSECVLSFLGSRIRANLAGSQEIRLKTCQTLFIANQTHIMSSNLVFTEHQLHNVLGLLWTPEWTNNTSFLSRLIFWWW